MNISNFVSYKLKYLSYDDFSFMESIFYKISEDLSIKRLNLQKYIEILLKDKKVQNNKSRIILSRGPGKMFIKKIDLDNKFNNLLQEYKDRY